MQDNSIKSSVDIVSVIRVIEYIGEREYVEKQIENSLHGTKDVYNGRVRITAVTLSEFPRSIKDGKLQYRKAYEVLNE